ARFRRLPDHRHHRTVEARSNACGRLTALLVPLLDLGALLLEAGAIGRGGAQRLLLRQQEVAGVPVLDADFVADMADAADALEQNDFHLFLSGAVLPGLRARVAVRNPGPSGTPTANRRAVAAPAAWSSSRRLGGAHA